MNKKSNLVFSRYWGMLFWYGLALGLLLAALQTARLRLTFSDHREEVYAGIIAALFTVLGAWVSRQIIARRSEKVIVAPSLPLEGAALEQVLDKFHITRREYEVLQLIAQGLSNQEIADQMFVSLNTIKTHTSNLFSKLDALRRTQAVEKARALGLLAPAHPKA